MSSFLADNLKQHCSGCSACVQVCAADAITFEKDSEGFSYPSVDKNKCVGCNKCISVCPFENKKTDEFTQEFYAAKSKEKSVINRSSSGGAFYDITKAFCDENYVLCGAEMSENLKVHHVCIEDFKDIEKLQKSKYVQSDMEDSFRKIRSFLKDGRKVLFSGMPCQVAGLRNFLGKDYDNLVTVDIVCHGVPSQTLFDKYLDELSDELGSKVVSFTFRNKKNFDKKSCNQKTALIKTENGKETVKEVLQCEYLAAFYDSLICRPSCGECPFTNTERPGDITLADFWGAGKYYPDFDDGKGVSLLIVNSQKGADLLKKTDLDLIKADKEKATENSTPLRRAVEFHKNRDKFFELNSRQGFCKSVKQCMDFPSPVHYKLYKLKTLLK